MSRFRLYPDATQEAALLGLCSHARFVWNLGLEQRSMYRRAFGPTPGYSEQCRQLTEARAAFDWLREGPCVVQQQALRDLDQAFKNFFKGTHRYPTWRKAGKHEGFRIVGSGWRTERVNDRWARVLIPKVGMVRLRLSRRLPEGAKSYRVTRDAAGRWHVAFAVAPDPIPAPGTGEVVGVDRGVTVSAALSTGEKLSCPGLGAKEAERLLRLERRLARAQPGSNRRATVKRKRARLFARAADRRKDWVEKTSTDLARRFDLIGLEDLRIEKMTRSAKGTLAKPGVNVRQKAGLNREVRKNGWGALALRLEHKASGRVVKIPAPYTSQRCSACGVVDGNSRKSQALFSCTSCGITGNADINAACNIRDLAVAASTTAAGRAVAGRGDMAALGRSMKRQPPDVGANGTIMLGVNG